MQSRQYARKDGPKTQREKEQTDGQCTQRDRNSEKEPKRNATDKPTVREIKNAFYILTGRLDMVEEKKNTPILKISHQKLSKLKS